MRRTCRSVARHHQRHLASDIQGLWPRLGRLYPRRIRRPPAAALSLRLPRRPRAVVRQPLHVWRRLRHGGGALAQDHAVRLVRDAPTAWRNRRRARHRDELACRPQGCRSTRRPCRRDHSRPLSDLLRPVLHESEGRAIRGRDDRVDPRPRPPRRGVSRAVAADDRDRRPVCGAINRNACAGRPRPDLRRRRLHPDLGRGRARARWARDAAPLRARHVRPDPRTAAWLPRHGPDLALVDHEVR